MGTIFEDAPAPTRDRLTTGWPLLGLQLGPLTSATHVLGWTILSNSPDQVLLVADGSCDIVAELLIERQPNTLRSASFIALSGPGAQEIWLEAGPKHERTVGQLLTEMLERTRRWDRASRGETPGGPAPGRPRSSRPPAVSR